MSEYKGGLMMSKEKNTSTKIAREINAYEILYLPFKVWFSN